MEYFIYGTLMDESILESLNLQIKSREVATMRGVTLYATSPYSFPFLVVTGDDNDVVQGLLVELEHISPIDTPIQSILDRYEGLGHPDPMYCKMQTEGLTCYVANMDNRRVKEICTNPANKIGGNWYDFQKRGKIQASKY